MYIHEKPLPLFAAIPILATPGLINLLIIDPVKTPDNYLIIDKFEHKFRILNKILGKVFFLLLFQTSVLARGNFFWREKSHRLLLVVSEFTS